MLGRTGRSIFVLAAGLLSAFGPESADARPRSGSVFIDGAEIHWVREGEGPSVFVIGSSIYYPKAYSATLRDHFELVFLDGRHFVPTYAPDPSAMSRIDLATFADDIEAIRIELGYDEIAVVGHSIHGQIALEYADRYPRSTTKVLLVAAVPYAFAEFQETAAVLWEELATDDRKALLGSRIENLAELLQAAPSSRSFAISYDRRAPVYWADPNYDARALLQGLENGPALDRLIAALPSRSEARARLERIQVPVLLVLGKLDFAIPYTAWEGLLTGLGSVEYVLLEADSHNPQTESPERFDPLMIDWLLR